MNFTTLKNSQASPAEFVSTWARCYNLGKYKESDYDGALNLKGELSANNIQLLFEWKNNSKLSAKKQKIVNNAKAKISTLNAFRQLPNIADRDFDSFWDFTYDLIDSGIVYRVFLAHISRPHDFPIVDQHVLRAWNFLLTNRIEEPEQTKQAYLGYRQFVLDLQKQSGKSLREVDIALMAFGQFLNSQFNSMLKS